MTSLKQKAEQTGIVRVIVTVSTTTAKLQALAPALREMFACETIDCAKLRVTNAMSSDNAVYIEPLSDLPLIVMEVTPQGLETLEQSPYIENIQEDTANPPFSAPQ